MKDKKAIEDKLNKLVEIQKKLDSLINEYRKVFGELKKLDDDSPMRAGGVILAIFSPKAKLGFNAGVGGRIYMDGLRARISRDASSSPKVLGGILGQL